MLLLLTGIGPLLAWRKSTLVNLRDQFLFPALAAAWSSAARWSRSACASGPRASASRSAASSSAPSPRSSGAARACVRQTTGTDLFTALIGLVGRNKRRYGGYIVHVGIVLMFLGFAGEGFKQTETVLLKPGQEVTVGDYTVRLDALKVTDDGRKQMVTADVTVIKGGVEIGKMYPARWFFKQARRPADD